MIISNSLDHFRFDESPFGRLGSTLIAELSLSPASCISSLRNTHTTPSPEASMTCYRVPDDEQPVSQAGEMGSARGVNYMMNGSRLRGMGT